MVKGFDSFKKWFAGWDEQYVIIGGTACELLLNEGGQDFRATKDIDMVLILEAMTTEFCSHFWQYIQVGEYVHRNKVTGEAQFYRFSNPGKLGFPSIIELFSRIPDGINLPEEAELTRISVDGEISSLSAILLDLEYYQFLRNGKIVIDGLPLLDAEHIIPFKAKAWLDLSNRKASGEQVDSKNIRKHKNDVFRLATLLTAESRISLSENIMADMTDFLEAMKNERINTRDIGIAYANKDTLLQLISDTYNL